MIIKNGHVVNPASGHDGIYDIKIFDGVVVSIEREIDTNGSEEVIDAEGLYVFPGFIDLHVHFRDPGLTNKEDIETGSKAAARGGYTTVCCMPNTKPVIDSVETVKYIIDKSKSVGLTNVLPVASITKGMKGEELNDIKALINAGAIAISEDGKSVMNAALIKEAMEIAAGLNIPVLSHCEDANLVAGGVMNEGAKSKEFGLPGISNSVENVIAARDMILADETGARLHLCHCSTKESVDYLRLCKNKNITGECCPHHFVLTEDDIPSGNSGEYKMNPPLRAKADKQALVKGLIEGDLGAIATDHAPHTSEEKSKGFLGAPFGIVGLETSAALSFTKLVKEAGMSVSDMIKRMSTTPASIIGVDGGDISKGKTADITLFDPNAVYKISAADFAGKGKSMPYDGMEVTGKVRMTILGGKIVYEDMP